MIQLTYFFLDGSQNKATDSGNCRIIRIQPINFSHHSVQANLLGHDRWPLHDSGSQQNAGPAICFSSGDSRGLAG